MNTKKTKKVTYLVDLHPGWQDSDYLPGPVDPKYCQSPKLPGYHRVKVTVEFPLHGGLADADSSVIADSEDANNGYKP